MISESQTVSDTEQSSVATVEHVKLQAIRSGKWVMLGQLLPPLLTHLRSVRR